jgi:hypothetical protein
MHWPTPEDYPHTRVRAVFNTPGWADDPAAVYVGMPGYAGQTEGFFGKPWSCLKDPRGWQHAFREYLVHRVQTDPVYAGAVMALHGKTLICFCKGGKRGPDAACHGDLLAMAAERLFHSFE